MMQQGVERVVIHLEKVQRKERAMEGDAGRRASERGTDQLKAQATGSGLGASVLRHVAYKQPACGMNGRRA